MDDSFGRELERLQAETAQLVCRENGLGEVFVEHSFRDHLTLSYRAGRDPHESYRHEITSGTGIRLIVGACTRSVAVDSLLPAKVLDAVGDLGLDRAAGAEPGLVRRPAADAASFRGDLALPPDAPDRVTLNEKRELLRAAADAAFSVRPSLDEVVVSYQGRVRRIGTWASDAQAARCASSAVGLRVHVRSGEAIAEAIGGSGGGVGCFLHDTPESVARTCIDRLGSIEHAAPYGTIHGRMPVVIGGGWGGAWLHEIVGHLLEADVDGPYGPASLGSTVACAEVTIADDGTMASGRGAYAFDDEGMPAQRTVLVDRGVLVGLMTDRATSLEYNLPRTANARRQDYRTEPMPRMTNLLLEPGTDDPSALIAGVEDGLYVQTAGNGQVRPSEDAARLEVVHGFRIRKGELAEPVTDLCLKARPSSMLRNVKAVARDFRLEAARGVCVKKGQAVPVSVGMPSVLIADLLVEPAA